MHLVLDRLGHLQGYDRTGQCIEQGRGCVRCEAEPIAGPGMGIQVGDGVGQPTGRMDDGQRAIAQRDQLPQAARLEGARHEKEVRPCIDTVGEGDVEADTRTHVAGALGKLTEHLLVARVPGAQHHELQGQFSQFSGDLGDEIEALLIDEPADDAYHRYIWIVRQPELLPQCRAIAGFGRWRLRRSVLNCQVAISRGIPCIPIEAIGNAEDTWMALKEDLVEAPAVVQRLDLLGVAVRDGCHHVSILDARFHPVHVAPELQAARDEDTRRVQPCFLQNGGIPASLVLQVMHGIDDAGCPPAQEVSIGGAQVGGTGGRLPIVEVDDIRRKVQVRQGLEQAPAKQEEAPLLVALVQSEVELLVPAKVPLVIKQVDGDRRIGEGGLVDRYALVEAGHGKRPHDPRGFERPAGGIDGPVARQKDAHLVA